MNEIKELKNLVEFIVNHHDRDKLAIRAGLTTTLIEQLKHNPKNICNLTILEAKKIIAASDGLIVE